MTITKQTHGLHAVAAAGFYGMLYVTTITKHQLETRNYMDFFPITAYNGSPTIIFSLPFFFLTDRSFAVISVKPPLQNFK
jgi:hypothetical protein